MIKKTLLALLLLATPAAAQNFDGAWPPEPYRSAAIASINAGRSPYVVVEPARFEFMGCSRGSLACTATGPLGPFIAISDGTSRRWRCLILIHEEAHRLGWAGGHAGGARVPSGQGCPLNSPP